MMQLLKSNRWVPVATVFGIAVVAAVVGAQQTLTPEWIASEAGSRFAETPRTIPVITPVVDSISGFIAVVPAEPSAELERFAADCVSAFEPFRAPLTAEERARRNPANLTSRQSEYLDRWGYPYVMEEFRFHMTLTGRLRSERREPVLAMLRSRFSDIGVGTLAVDRIALFRQDDAASRFRVIRDCLLKPD